jgi:protein-S-isoprenylcysteine O-methyltransferase Ste14
MNIWFAKSVILIAAIVMVVIRAPHGKRSRSLPVVESRKWTLEVFLLSIAWIAFLLPLLWIVTPWLSFADFPLSPVAFLSGTTFLVVGLWLFHRSHVDLGTNWSISLELRESHRLITEGLYRNVRHPMYTALLLYGIGQVLAVPNRIVGPSYLIAMVVLVAFRLGPEEALMRSRFGSAYDDYASRTKRLVPRIW